MSEDKFQPATAVLCRERPDLPVRHCQGGPPRNNLVLIAFSKVFDKIFYYIEMQLIRLERLQLGISDRSP